MQQFWEERYSENRFAYGEAPNDYLQHQSGRLHAGQKVLMVGDGEGRNGVWLARQGLEVTSVDMARSGLDKAQQLAARHRVSIETVHADLAQWAWPENTFDAVVAIHVHFPPALRPVMHRNMLAALKPGGLLIAEYFHKQQLGRTSGGPPVAEMLYDETQMRSDLEAAEWLQLQVVERHLDEGPYHQGKAMLLQMVARRTERAR